MISYRLQNPPGKGQITMSLLSGRWSEHPREHQGLVSERMPGYSLCPSSLFLQVTPVSSSQGSSKIPQKLRPTIGEAHSLENDFCPPQTHPLTGMPRPPGIKTCLQKSLHYHTHQSLDINRSNLLNDITHAQAIGILGI